MPTPTWASTGERSGFHLLSIDGYSRAKDMPTGTALASSPFMAGGYRWAMYLYPNGQTPEDADFMSVSFSLIQDVAHPVKVRVVFSFMNEHERQDPRYVRTMPIIDIASRSQSHMVCRWFMAREDFEKSEHLKFDCFVIRLDLIVIEEGHQQ
jgi:speckle-type POZ protein